MRRLLAFAAVIITGIAWANTPQMMVLLGSENNGVNLDGHSNYTTNTGATSYAYIYVNSDGNMYERENTDPQVQIDAATDWVRPTTDASLYEARFTNLSCGLNCGYVSSTNAEDAWVSMASGSWYVRIYDNTSGATNRTASFDIEVRLAATGQTIATAEYQIGANEL